MAHRHTPCPPNPQCSHSHGLRHSVAIQVSSVPSVSTQCCPCTPSSMRLQATSCKDSCNNCRDSEICLDTLPQYCPYNVNNKQDIVRPFNKEKSPERTKESHEKLFQEHTNGDPKLVVFKDADISPRNSLEAGPISQNKKDIAMTTNSQLEMRTNEKLIKRNTAQASTSGTIYPLTETSKQRNNSGSDYKADSIKENVKESLSKVSFDHKLTCHTLKKPDSEPLLPTSNTLQEKRSHLQDNKLKQNIGISCSMCTSKTCAKKESTKCQCRYPPAFSRFGCIGKIAGNCECDKQ